MRTQTRLVAGTGVQDRLPHILPLDLSTTYRTPDPELAARSIGELAAGAAEAANPIYARLCNPNVRDFETRMTSLEEGRDSVAFASGMAAVTALLLEAQGRGCHVVAVPPLYGGTHHLLSSGLLHSQVTWAAPEDVRRSIRPDTGLVLVETPSNPTLTVTDIEQLARDAGDVPVAVDSTFATPVLQRPLVHGAAYALHSATKFIGGHGDAMGGVITTADGDAAARLRQIRIATGAVLHPIAAHLFSRGLQTLGLRVLAQQSNARELVARLRGHPEVIAVRFPGADEEDRAIVSRQMAGPGSMITIRLRGGAERADAFLSHLGLAVPAVSLGAVDTLVERPAALTHQSLGPEEMARVAIQEDLVRVSVGAEDVEDLWEDFDRAIGSSVGSNAAEAVLAGR